MRILHRFAMHEDDPLWSKLESAGAKIDRKGSYIWVCVLDDEDSVWKKFKDRLLAKPDLVFSKAVYSKEELNSAAYLEVIARGHHGYPQPERNLDYIKQVYGAKSYCDSCGIGGRQIAPFRIRKEFGALHSQFLQLNWVFDEFFARNPAATALKDAGVTGISWQAPIIHKSGEASTDVVQMMVEETLSSSVTTIGFQKVTCKPDNEEVTPQLGLSNFGESQSHCGRIKYHRKPEGPLRLEASAFECAPDIIKTADWFGSGRSAFRLILVSQKVYRIFQDAGWRGVEFEPVQLHP